MNEEQINNFEKCQTQIEGLLSEIGLLSKKNPNDAVNKFKLIFINELITNANIILTSDYMPFKSFNDFDVDSVPSNSDVTFILSQYLNCFEKLRADNIYCKSEYIGGKYHNNWYWRTGNKKLIATSQPNKIK